MTSARDRRGRALEPDDPLVCPVCRDVIGRRGLVRHLTDRHGKDLAGARVAASKAVPPVKTTRQRSELAARALELRRCLAELPALGLSEASEASIRSGWEAELAGLQAQIEQAEADRGSLPG